MTLRFHGEAREEYVDALLYIEERREGYGQKFEDEVESALERALNFPTSGTQLPGFPPALGLRAFPIRRFPYSLVASARDGAVVIYAVAHQRREPSYWHERL